MHDDLDSQNPVPALRVENSLQRRQQHGEERQVGISERLVGHVGVVVEVAAGVENLGKREEVLEIAVQERLALERPQRERQGQGRQSCNGKDRQSIQPRSESVCACHGSRRSGSRVDVMFDTLAIGAWGYTPILTVGGCRMTGVCPNGPARN